MTMGIIKWCFLAVFAFWLVSVYGAGCTSGGVYAEKMRVINGQR